MDLIKLHFCLATAGLFLTTSLSTPTHAQDAVPALVRTEMADWPQWRGPKRDGVSEETGLLTAWPEAGPSRLWTAGDIGHGYSSPIVVDGMIFITGDVEDDLIISAFALDGTSRWQVKNGKSWQKSYPGARSSCTFDNGHLYHMNAHGRLACLDAKTGSEKWFVNILDRFAGKNITWGISESLLVHGDLVYATPCGAKGLVVALNKLSGETVWVTPAITDEQPSYASPILVAMGDRRLLVNSATKNAFAVDAATGELSWQVPQVDPKNTVSTIPVLAGNQIVLTNASRGFGAVFGVQFDTQSAVRMWSKELTISHGSTLAVDGTVFGASGRGVAKGWVAIEPTQQSLQTVADLDVGSITYADGHFYCLTERGMMTLQKPTASGFDTVGSFRLGEGKDVWAHPVICGGKLYLRCKNVLSCYDIGE